MRGSIPRGRCHVQVYAAVDGLHSNGNMSRCVPFVDDAPLSIDLWCKELTVRDRGLGGGGGSRAR